MSNLVDSNHKMDILTTILLLDVPIFFLQLSPRIEGMDRYSSPAKHICTSVGHLVLENFLAAQWVAVYGMTH